MAKWCFWGFFFEVLRLLWCLFGVSAIVPKVLKLLVFPGFWAFLGWLLLVYLCLEGLGVFVFLVFVFLVFGFVFGVGIISVCLLCFVLWLDVVVSVSDFLCLLFFFAFFVLFFLFFGGFKGQVRWPEGPPHLALNLLIFWFLFFVCCFLLFLCCFFVCFCFFLEGIRVR